ncbi:MAG TPA: ATP-binding protein [Bacteroidales bacterium]|nr:ATP-binding protein [Bacteroidales bacterium]HSA43880.1 ATP-binding protein [Bacteroidales bacterium]
MTNILNGQSTSLISARRMGKTGLIKHVLNKLSDSITGIYLDILATENRAEMLNQLATAVVMAVQGKKGPAKKVLTFIKSLRPVFTYDPLSGMPQVSFHMHQDEINLQIESLFLFLGEQQQSFLIAIDEFQQILFYPEKNTDAWLRSIIQSLPNICFIFSGSRQHLMTDLFSNPSRPFFRSADFMSLGRISSADYIPFIGSHFSNARKEISDQTIREVLEWSDHHTYYVQLLCNRLFAKQIDNITMESWKQTAHELLMEQELLFIKYRELLTRQQWELMKAVAREGKVFEPTSKGFIARYGLGSPSTVFRSLQALQQKEMIYDEYDNTGNQYWSVYDVLFRRWMGLSRIK